VFLEDFDLGDRDALRIELHLTTVRARVDDLCFAIHLEGPGTDDGQPAPILAKVEATTAKTLGRGTRGSPG
jgi:hypothetical protein